MPSATVKAGYSTGGGWSNTAHKEHVSTDITDKNGIYVYKKIVMNRLEDIFANIKKDGYYSVYAQPVKFWESNKGLYSSSDNPLMVTLKRIINPTPMYHKKANQVLHQITAHTVTI